MVNSKAIGGGIIVIIVIIVAFAFSQDQEDISKETLIESIQDSSVSISDSATVSKGEDTPKNYIINAADDPLVEDK